MKLFNFINCKKAILEPFLTFSYYFPLKLIPPRFFKPPKLPPPPPPQKITEIVIRTYSVEKELLNVCLFNKNDIYLKIESIQSNLWWNGEFLEFTRSEEKDSSILRWLISIYWSNGWMSALDSSIRIWTLTKTHWTEEKLEK